MRVTTLILTLFIFSGCTQPLKKLSLENTIWGFNNGFTSTSIILKKQNSVYLTHFSDSGPTIYSRKGTYQIRNNLLLVNFPKTKYIQKPIEIGSFKTKSNTHNLPALRQKFVIYSSLKKQRYLAEAGKFKLVYLGKYTPNMNITIPLTTDK